MKKLEGREKLKAFKYLMDAAVAATHSNCLRSKGGAVIVNTIDGHEKIIGRNCNHTPRNKNLEKCLKDDLPEDFKSDRTCCIHAEGGAIDNAIDIYGKKSLEGATIYFIRLNLDNRIISAGKPYCTICSKDALDKGIKNWILLHKSGIYSYDADEYNELSFGRLEWELENQKLYKMYDSKNYINSK